MKKLLLSAVAFGALLTTQAQTFFSESFDTEIPTTWTILDEDGLTSSSPQSAYASWAWNSNSERASSTSWYDNSGTGPTDDWLITPQISIPATGTNLLSFFGTSNEPNFLEEYEVLVSTGGTNTVDFTDTLLSVTDESDNGTTHSLDLSSYNGQDIYIAFHHISDDESLLSIDDVECATLPNNDLELASINVDSGLEGDRTFSIDVENTGSSTITDFDVEWSWDGSAPTVENVTGVSLNYGDVHTISVQVNGITPGNGDFTAEITTADDVATNNTLSETFIFDVPVPQYVANDSYGNEFDLHAALSSGQAIVLDFMASWCGPCESSTPEISEFVENNGSGDENVEALAITVEQNDDAATLNGLDWNGGFYEYPKFPYSSDNNYQYYHYAVNHDFNPGNGIPFFVMICPDTQNPAYSSIVKNDVAYGQGMFGAYQTELDNCPSATAKLIQNELEPKVNVYPNPATSNVTVDMKLYGKTDVDVQLVNNLGQVVATQHLNETAGAQSVQLNVSGVDAGIYMVKVKTANTETTRSISVLK